MLRGIFERAVVVDIQAFAVVGALVLGRHLQRAPGDAAGTLLGLLAFGAVLLSALRYGRLRPGHTP